LTDTLAAGSEHREINRLVREAQSGHVGAFDALLELFAERVYRFVVARVPEHEAEDITQRVFMQVIEGLPRYVDRGLPFGSWLFRIARNVIVDAARARREDVPLETMATTMSPGLGPAEYVEAAAGRLALRNALAALPSDQRDVLALRYFADLSTREIAQSMGKHEGHIRVLQFRGLRALRQRLAPRVDPVIDRIGFGEADI
jgi:RNA polymerase sigma-70 factor (ECF subfamily)